ncbi:MAG TPA: universal stress protein [Pilimelia sp.]|nr:universal stress protein [Pilimelia sp.]
MDSSDVIVGVDGSEPGRNALRWAADEVLRGGGRLRVLLAYHWQPAVQLLPDDNVDTIVQERARLAVEQAVAEAWAAAPGITVAGMVVRATPAAALLDAASGARLLVVGSRSRGGLDGLLRGSVSLHVAAQVPCPVAVVRGDAHRNAGPVVVGVKNAASSSMAVGLAFAQAAARGCAILAAHAHTRFAATHTHGAAPAEEHRQRLHHDPAWVVDPWRDKYPHVPVEYAAVAGHPVQVLIAISHRAQLVVVGARGLGARSGPLLGSTSQHLAHRAGCPVLIAHESTR